MNRVLFYLCLCLLHVCSGQGPVYVNPAASAQQPQQEQQNEAVSLVTQTVYGFLDFTTTIGNTVMVFSPQSAEAPLGIVSSSKPPTTVIETRPPTTAPPPPPAEIKPSKTVTKGTSEKKPAPAAKPVTTGDAKTNAPQTVVFTSVAVATAKPAPPAVSSHVEVRAGPPSSVVEVRKSPPSSVVEVRGGDSSVVLEVVRAPVVSSVAEIRASQPAPTLTLSSVVEIHSSSDDEDHGTLLTDNALEPEYDFLSRQPSEVVDETYKIINLKPSSKFHLKPRASTTQHHKSTPALGVVSKLPGGTIVRDGTTTVVETSVVGTLIGGKYATVLQSNSRVIKPPRVAPTSTARILKTAAPGRPRPQQHQLEPTPVVGTLAEDTAALPLEALFSSAPTLTRNSRRPAVSGGARNNLSQSRPFHRNKGKESTEPETEEQEAEVPPPSPSPSGHGKHKKHSSSRAQSTVRPTATQRPGFRPSAKNAGNNNRFGRPEVATVSVYHETPTPTRRNKDSGATTSQRRFRPSSAAASAPAATAAPEQPPSRRSGSGFKSRVQASAPEPPTTASSSVYKFKLNRPSGRWQYKTTPKPRVTIRRQNDDEENSVSPNTTPQTPSASPSSPASPQPQYSPPPTPPLTPQALARVDTDGEQDLETAQGENDQQVLSDQDDAEKDPDAQTVVAETLKVEISTPADFKDIYYEIATIKSPYTFQVGTVRNTRFITVTSTFERSLEPTRTEAPAGATVAPAPENILALEPSVPLEAGMATLPPLTLGVGTETPPLETLTETFSTTTLLLKTHVLPVVPAVGNATRYTLVQSYHVTRHVTATRTLPPTQLYQFEPSRTLTDFSPHLEEAGSELHLELDIADHQDQQDQQHRDEHARPKKAPAPLILDNNQQQLLQPTVQPPLTPDQLQQIALLRFLNPAAAAALQQVVTTSRPVLKLETLFESHVVPVYDGQSTVYSTIKRPLATVSKTEFEYGTTTIITPPPQQPQLNPLQQNPLQQQQQYAITSTPVVTQTVVTATDSKVLKLTFGAKTAYTTLISTRVVPTVLTTYVTASIPVQPTAPPAAAFPGFFPPPYAQYPFVG